MASQRGQASPLFFLQVGREASSSTRYRLSVSSAARSYTSPPGRAGFSAGFLEPGERKTVTFLLHSHQLGYYHEAMRYAVQPGAAEVIVGGSSEHLPLAGALEIIGQTTDASDHKVFFSRIEIE